MNTARGTSGQATGVAAPKALSLHIGLNAVSARHYAGWSGELTACEADARDMAALAAGQGMKTALLLTRQATRARVLAGLRSAARQLKPGDYFLLSYSGHGGQVPDRSGEETDRKDETWCLWDGQLIDDEIHAELAAFRAGVRVLVLSDSCHSGTVTRAAEPPAPAAGRSRAMPGAVALRVYRDHAAFYDDLQAALTRRAGTAALDPDTALAQVALSSRLTRLTARLAPAVLLISGCQDNQTSMDGEHNGAFTGQLLAVWNHGRFQGNHAQFHAAIVARLPATQTPRLSALGPAAAFIRQSPFQP